MFMIVVWKQFEDVVEAIANKHKYNIKDYNAPEKRKH